LRLDLKAKGEKENGYESWGEAPKSDHVLSLKGIVEKGRTIFSTGRIDLSSKGKLKSLAVTKKGNCDVKEKKNSKQLGGYPYKSE